MKKLYTLFASVLLTGVALCSRAQNQPVIKPVENRSGELNFTSFSQHTKDKASEVAAGNKGFERDPELGMRTENMPCADCYELIGKRTETSKVFAKKGTDANNVIVQSSNFPMHFRDERGNWKSISNVLHTSPVTPGVYATDISGQPLNLQINAVAHSSSITLRDAGSMTYNRDLELVFISTTGTESSLGAADWSHFTAGDNGVRVQDAWPGIDIEMSVRPNGIKTNFVVNHSLPSYAGGKLVLRDHVQLSKGLKMDATQDKAFTGNINVVNEGGDVVFNVSTAVAYEKYDYKHSRQDLQYVRGMGDVLDIVVPGDMLNKPAAYYPLVIDPLVATNSITGPNFSRYPAYCTATNNVPIPAGTTITDVQVGYAYAANAAGLNLSNAAFNFTLYTCTSPNPTLYSGYGCTGPVTSYCGTSGYSIYGDIAGCVPGFNCTAYTLPVTIGCTQGVGTTGGSCSNFYFYSFLPFQVSVYGVLTPVPATITGTPSVCVGNTSTLTNATAGGVWISDAPGVASIDISSGVVSGISTGTATISYVLSGCVATTIVTVSTVGTISGPSTVCPAGTITLSCTPSGGTWSSSSTGIATVGASTGIVTGVSGGTTTITYTTSVGCFAIKVVTVSALPSAITGSLTVCVGSTTTLSNATTGGGTWASSNTSVATITSGGVVTGVANGTSVITFTATATGCYITAVVSVNSLPAIITGVTSVCVASTTTLSDATTGGTWTSGGGAATVGASSGIVTGVSAGTVNITYTLSSGCYRTIVVTVYALPGAITGSLTVCTGLTTSLGNSSAGGTWSSSNTSVATVGLSSGVVSGVVAGTSTIVYTLGSGCSTSAIVTVYTSPAAISGAFNICVGNSTTLTDATPLGTWSSSATGVATITSAGVVAGVAAGTTNISYTLSSGCYATAVMSVTALPAAIAGIANVCVGYTTTLADAVTGGTWVSDNTTIASIGLSTGIVTGVSVGTTTVTYSIVPGCTVTKIVTVNPNPDPITGPTFLVCVGQTITLSDATTGGSWSSGATGLATVGATTGIVTGVTAGNATISYIISATGCFITDIVTVKPLPAAITGVSSLCVGATFPYTDATTGGTWSSSNTAVGTIDASSGAATGIANGTTVLTYTLATGCYITKIVTVEPLPPAMGGTLSLCVGATTTLTNSVTGGTWSSGNVSVATIDPSSGVVNGISAGTSTITFRSPAGCAITAVVTVNPLPASIGGTLTVCVGSTTSLTDASTGGTWTSGSTGIATIGASSGVAAGGTAGNANITYTLSTGCFTSSVLTVNPVPAAIGGTLAVCSGLTTTLSDATPSGTWSSSNSSVASITSGGVVTGVATTFSTATITYTLGTGCYSTATVTVNPLPSAITGTLSVCAGLTTTLSDPTTGGTWTSGSTGIATIGASSGIVTGVAGGTAVITYTLSTGCYTTAIVTVNSLPGGITGTASVCVGLTTTLSSTTTGGTWTSGNTTVASIGASSGVVTGVANGTSIITYTASTGCIVTRTVTVYALPAAITGTAVVCAGLTTTLACSTTGGTWTSGTTSVATISSGGVVTGVASGTSNITYTVTSTGCYSIRVVTVNPIPNAITGTATLCVGTNTTLSTTSTGGTWVSSNTAVGTVGSNTGIVTGITSGTTRVSYVLSTGCVNSIIVTVYPLPTAIGGTLVVCVGSVTSLTNGTGGGTWTSGNTAIATIGASNGAALGMSSGTADITYTLGSGCNVTAVLTVNPVPNPITGSASVCLGLTSSLASTTTGGTWSSSNTSIATVGASNGVVTGVAIGNATISYTLSTGCYAQLPITVNPLPASITGPSQVCGGGATITLADASTGGNWSSSNTAIATVNSSGVVSGVSGGTVNISYTLGTGCYITKLITVYPIPASNITPLGDTTFCPGGFVVLTANTGSGFTYQWLVGGTNITGAVSATYIANVTGSYQAQITNSFGCSTLSTPMLVTVDTAFASITVSGGGSSTTCSGTPVTLDANTGTGLSYQWQLDGVAISGAVGSVYTTTAPGDYTVVVSNTTGCSATSSAITVSISPDPSVVLSISGPLTFCAGNNVVIGVPAVTGYTYQWYNASGAIGGAVGANYTATASGNYYVVVTSDFGCIATSATSAVVVNPLPSPAIVPAGPTMFCTGGSVMLNATSGGGLTYQWYKGGVAISGATNASYLANTSGGYRVRVTITATGCSDQTHADTVVTVVGTPVVVPITATSFCWGGGALLGTSVTGGAGLVTYQWFKDGVAIPGAGGSTYNATTPGLYKVSISITGSCTMVTSEAEVTENPLPNPVVTFDGTTFRTANYFVSYQWYKDLVLIPGATTNSTPATGNGNYKVAVTDTNGCQSVSPHYVLTGWTGGTGGGSTAVVTPGNEEVNIYPNPAAEVVYVASPVVVSADVTAMDGRLLMHVNNAREINLAGIADGIYVIKVYNQQQVLLKTEKLVKASK